MALVKKERKMVSEEKKARMEIREGEKRYLYIQKNCPKFLNKQHV